MCRIFGFRSVIPSQVHQSLVSAENALMLQSERHPDGWGVAYYVAGAPHVIKSASTAISDQLFKHVSGIVSSETVLAHIRKATHGNLSLINSHPFQYGNWIFAHNGDVPNFAEHREEVIAKIPPIMRRFILGDTDSEVIFYLLLSHLSSRFELHRKGYPLDLAKDALAQTVDDIQEVTGLDCHDESNKLYLTFLLTNGQMMAAHQGGKELFFSTYKQHCPERDICPHYAKECEKPTDSGFVSHMIFSSEPLQGQNVWLPMSNGQIVGVDWRMHLRQWGSSSVVPLESVQA